MAQVSSSLLISLKSHLFQVIMSSENEIIEPSPVEETVADTSTNQRPQPKVVLKLQDSELYNLNKLLLDEGIKLGKLMTSVTPVPKFNKEKLVQNCIKWMSVCCNVEDYYDFPMALNILKVLIKQSAEYKELNGPVTYFLKNKFFAKFFRYFVTLEEGWKCVELCAVHYKNSCGVYQDRLKEVAVCLFEKRVVPKAVTRAYALLPKTGESGTDGIMHANKWNILFEDLLRKCNYILRDLLKDIVECQFYGEAILMDEKYCSVEAPDEELLYRLFCNYCNVLRFMLLCAFPATKCFMPQKIFNIICRCLNVTSNTLGNLDTTRKIKINQLLPKFHIIANSLLKALILSCKTHLLPYSFLITKVIYQTIQLTDVNLTVECNELCLMLRITAYDNWMKWATVSNGAGIVLSADIASSALHDLTVPSFTERVEDDNDNTERDQGDPDIIIRTHPLRKMLGIVAVNVLSVYTRTVGSTLRADQLKDIQTFVVEGILKIHHSTTLEFPYSSAKYRLGLYSLLRELVNCRSSVWGPPVNWALELFKRGVHDSDFKVSTFCSSALPDVLNIIDQEVIRFYPSEME